MEITNEDLDRVTGRVSAAPPSPGFRPGPQPADAADAAATSPWMEYPPGAPVPLPPLTGHDTYRPGPLSPPSPAFQALLDNEQDCRDLMGTIHRKMKSFESLNGLKPTTLFLGPRAHAAFLAWADQLVPGMARHDLPCYQGLDVLCLHNEVVLVGRIN